MTSIGLLHALLVQRDHISVDEKELLICIVLRVQVMGALSRGSADDGEVTLIFERYVGNVN